MRYKYAFIALLLIPIEIYIAVYVHDDFIRPYVGDILAVILLYTIIRTIIPYKCKLLPLYIFVFSIVVEILQYFDITQYLGRYNNTFITIIFGSVFDVIDILCYFIGSLILFIYELFIKRKIELNN